VWLTSASGAEGTSLNPRTVYFTVGDSQDMLWTPLDSKASIEAVFAVLHDRYRVSRVWWRGGQDEIWGNQFVLREQNRYFWRVWEWWRDLQYRVVKCNALAVNAAHQRSMEIWMAYGLFDNGSPADVGYVGFPYAAEDKIRVEHPEWAPANKYGTWRQGGPIEFCYEGARKAMVEYLTKYVVEGNYDGIAFLTYAENYSQRYEDEFGYNQPIVDEFKRRYGVDIRTEPFDKVAWSKLRGEYLTQFFRELHASLGKSGKKIAMSVDGNYPYWPCRWGGEKGVRTAGKLWMDVETWIREGIIDELNLFHPISDEAIQKGVEFCRGTRAKLSAWGKARGELPAGAIRLLTVNFELESGFDWENYIDWPDEIVPVQPLAALKSSDVYARRRILCAIEKGKQTAPTADVIPLTKDADVFVRRAALRALGKLQDKSAIPAAASALLDPENSVRWQAAVVLGQLNAPNCVAELFDAVARPNSSFQFNFNAVITVLADLKQKGKLGDTHYELILSKTSSPDPKVREVAWNALRRFAPARTERLGNAALRALKEDSDPYVKELALSEFTNLEAKPEYLDALYESLTRETDAVVQICACKALISLARQDPNQFQAKALQTVTAFFRQYGEGCGRSDKDWGWRAVGNTLRDGFGEAGKAALEQMRQQKEDRHLAELAWRVIYLKQENGFTPMTEEQDREAHLHHPFLKFGEQAKAN
jgi:hypothetical protein